MRVSHVHRNFDPIEQQLRRYCSCYINTADHIRSSLNVHTHQVTFTLLCVCFYDIQVRVKCLVCMCICTCIFGFLCIWNRNAFCSHLIYQFFYSLGENHIGYKRKDFADLKLSIIGGRPLSSGGDTFGYSNNIISKRFLSFIFGNMLKD